MSRHELHWECDYYGFGDERWCYVTAGNRRTRGWLGGIMRKRWYEKWLAYIILPDGSEPSLGRFETRGKARRAVRLAVRSLQGQVTKGA